MGKLNSPEDLGVGKRQDGGVVDLGLDEGSGIEVTKQMQKGSAVIPIR